MPIVAESICVSASKEAVEPFLRNVSLTLREGEMAVVVGAAGAGKSTLLDALAGLRPLEAGAVLYDGRPLWRKGRVDPDINLRIGAVFQHPGQGLFAATVLRELRYSLRPLRLPRSEEGARVAASLAAAGLPADVLERSPFTLSGGQQRRVGLAAAVVAEPDWLFLDEPTSALDPAGAAEFAEWLRRRRAAAPHTGVVVATHDLDTFLPLADRVLVLQNGKVTADAAPSKLADRPELLLEAGVGLPAYIETAVLLRRHGIDLAADPAADRMADALSGFLQKEGASPMEAAFEGRGPGGDAPDRSGAAETARVSGAALPASTPENAPLGNGFTKPDAPLASMASNSRQRMGWAQKLDPRVKWLVLLLVTAGMLAQRSWSGVAWSAAAALAVVLAAGLPLRRYGTLLRAYLLFSALSVLVAGLQLHAVLSGGSAWFSRADALTTALSLLRFVPAMLLGLLFAQSTRPMELKRGLEQSVPHRKGKGGALPLEVLAFSAAMLFQFVPLLSEQWERFSRIVRMRGKSGAKPGRVAVRDMPAVLAPLLVASFQLAERLSLAVEARGYRLGEPRTASVDLRWTGRDWLALAAGAALAAALWLIR